MPMRTLRYSMLLLLLLLPALYTQAQLTPMPDSLIAKAEIKALYFENTRLSTSNTFGFSYIVHTQSAGAVSFFIEYRHSHNKAIMDDEFIEQWYFMMPAGTRKKFELSGAEALKANEANYCKLCYCVDAGCHPAADDWIISGRKKGKKWQINIRRGEKTYTFTAIREKFENFPK